MAQFGVGFGTWNGSFGSWFSFWPQWRGYSEPRRTRPAVQNPTTPANGYVEGQVVLHGLCPANQERTSCPPAPDEFRRITISATLNGSAQWLGIHPDTQGHYRLLLPPGNYALTVQHPNITVDNRIHYQIRVQPGQATRQDFQVDLPAS